MRTISVALPLPLRQNFSYRVPESLPLPVPGVRVRVPFGERVLTGVVMAADGRETPEGLREVVEILDEEPVCPSELLGAAARVAERFFASTGEVLKSALPARLPAAGTARYRITGKGAFAVPAGAAFEREILERLSGGEAVRLGDLPGQGVARREILRSLEERGWIRVVSANRRKTRSVEIAYLPSRAGQSERAGLLKRSRRGREVLDCLDTLARPATAAELKMRTGAGAAVLRDLVAKGLLLSFEQEPRREESPPPFLSVPRGGTVLTSEQQAAFERISAAIRDRKYFPALLEGITGSGKTEVYLRAIAATLEAGQSAIWLVPEIALTPVFSRELSRQFGERAAVLHSALSERERAQAWDRVRAGQARAVIGPRSASFAPVTDPGLFVVDEEHDSSYKQRESPRYDAREVVSIRARRAGAVLLFGSATPSMEAYQAARSGRLASLKLTSRIESRQLPQVTLVDLRKEVPRPEEKGVPLFSRVLISRLEEVFSRGEQAILLQPRRGWAPFLLCRDCGHDFRCGRCSVSRTVHGRGRFLLCHYCGERLATPPRCPECGGSLLEAIGAGTERVAERFAERFPGISYAVLDRDTARQRRVGAVVDEMISGKVSCLIGTQMVAKGHDFPDVTAVGVLSADTILNFPDFRAAEKTFQLVSQVAGRAGRGEQPGTVHVQTFHPDHPAIRRAAEHDLEGFAKQELEFRRAFFYPPFADLASVLVSSVNRERAGETAEVIGRQVRLTEAKLRISGPAPAPLARLQGKWRFQLLLRAGSRRDILEALEASLPERPPSGVQIAVDVDPQDLM